MCIIFVYQHNLFLRDSLFFSSIYSSYQCECPASFGGLQCEVLKTCSESKPCLNGGACENSVCRCKSGFKGFHCEEDINECLLPNISCQPPATCFNLIGSYRCICPVNSKGLSISSCVNPSSIQRSPERSFLWDDLLFMGILAIILLFSLLIIVICCYLNRTKSVNRHNRTPNNIYRAGLVGNEFLLKNCDSFSDNNVNIKRFSKLCSGLETSSLLAHNQFSSSEPLPNHHFHQALAVANNNTSPNGNNIRPTSFATESLNNFDEDFKFPNASAEEASASNVIDASPDSVISIGKKKKTSSASSKSSPTVLSPKYVDNHSDSSQIVKNNEGKIQNSKYLIMNKLHD